MSAAVLLAALALDAWLGEARRWHPLVGFGRLARWIESRLHGHSRWRGLLAVTLLLAPAGALACLIPRGGFGMACEIAALYFAIGWTSLAQHARAVRDALNTGSIAEARTQVGRMVSRETAALDESGVAAATVESVLENGNDAIFGALFWFALAGAPGVLIYRLANTLDAMWGYRNERYCLFGWAAARLDDLLNYLPARLTALGYAVVGDTHRALRCWRQQATSWDSPNAGPVMSAGAGSLALALGGPASYHGTVEIRPALGQGAPASAADIDRALALVNKALALWVAVLTCVLAGFALWP